MQYCDERLTKILAGCFFVLLLCAGFFTYRDYGLSWDEPGSRQTGLVSFNYLVKNDPTLLNYPYRNYAPAVEIFLVGVEKSFGITDKDPQEIFYIRHLFTFLIFYLGVVFFYLLCKEFYADRLVALLGCLMLVICPRIFAHAFINSKDIPFMSMMILSMWSTIKFLKKPDLTNACLHGFCCGLTIDTRIAGILMPLITSILFSIHILLPRRSLKSLGILGLYLFFTSVVVVLMWPALWSDPLANFVLFFKTASQYPWNGSVFYFGQWLFPIRHELPWHYLLVWMGITIPLCYIILFLIGSINSFFQIIIKSNKSLRILLPLMVFIPPLTIAIFTKVINYNEWRHFYFIYPAFVLLALDGYVFLTHTRRYISIMTTSLLFLNISFTAFSICTLHPFEDFYSNGILGNQYDQIYRKFQLDLWLTEYKAPLEFIARSDPRPMIKLYLSTSDGSQDTYILSNADRERFVFVNDPRIANYNIIDFYHANDHKDLSVFGQEIYALTIQNVKVVRVFKYLP